MLKQGIRLKAIKITPRKAIRAFLSVSGAGGEYGNHMKLLAALYAGHEPQQQ